MTADTLPDLPPKPERPYDSDCCGNGCDPCIFTCYAEELARWQKAVDAATAAAGGQPKRP